MSGRLGSIRGSVLLLAAAALSVFSTGCGDPFDPVSLVNKPRILGIRAEQPWLLPGESTDLSVLAVEPEGRPLSYAWSACLFTLGGTSGYACADPQLEFDLGQDATALFDPPITPEMLDAICLEITTMDLPDFVDLPDCERYIPVTVRVDITAPASPDDGGEEVVISAIKEMRLLTDETMEPNLNPAIDLLTLDEQPLDPGDSPALLLDESYDLAVVIPESASERFANEDGQERSEELLISWFTTAGEIDKAKTYYAAGETDLSEASKNKLTTPDELPTSGDLTVFVLVRDGRGGLGWIEQGFVLVSGERD